MKSIFQILVAAFWLAAPIPSIADHEAVEGREATVYLGPEELAPEEAAIGKRIPDVTLGLIGGGESGLYAGAGSRGTVVVVRDPECPVSRRYGPRIAKLARRFGSAGFGFVFIYLNEELDAARLREDAQALGVSGTFAARGSFALADALGVKSTGEVFVLDAGHRLRFRGAVDDQYGLGYTKDVATRHYLRHALEALLEGEPVQTPATSAPGCVIDADPEKDRLFQPAVDGQMIS
jgi:hypothetical protein